MTRLEEMEDDAGISVLKRELDQKVIFDELDKSDAITDDNGGIAVTEAIGAVQFAMNAAKNTVSGDSLLAAGKDVFK